MPVSASDIRYPNGGGCFIMERWERKRQFPSTYYVMDSCSGQHDCWASLQCNIGFIVPILQTENRTQKDCVPCASSHGGGRAGILTQVSKACLSTTAYHWRGGHGMGVRDVPFQSSRLETCWKLFMQRSARKEAEWSWMGPPGRGPTPSGQLSSPGLRQDWLCSAEASWLSHKLVGACEGTVCQVSQRFSPTR